MTELTSTEMAQIDGGIIWIPIVVAIAVIASSC